MSVMVEGQSVPPVASAPGGVNRVVFLVHGTFANSATWIMPDSGLGKKLTALGNTRVIPFRWSGANSLAGRVQAAKDLAKAIKGVYADDPQAEVHLVGHSHGGNVIRYAISSSIAYGDALAERVRSCVYLGTPFISHTPRNLLVLRAIMRASGWLFAVSVLFNVAAFVLGNASAQDLELTDAEIEVLQREIFSGMADGLILVARVVAILIFSVALLVFWMLRSMLENINSSRRAALFELPTGLYGRRNHDVVISYRGDEAKRLLVMLGAPLRAVLSILRLFLRTAVPALRINKMMIWAMFLSVPVVVLLAPVGPEAGHVLFLLPALPLWHLVALSWSGLAVVVAIFLAALLNKLFQTHSGGFGSEPMRNYLLYDIGIGLRPPQHESRRVSHQHLASNRSLLVSARLRHSAYYDHDECQQLVVNTVSGDVADTSHDVVHQAGLRRRRVPRFLHSLSYYVLFLVLTPALTVVSLSILLTFLHAALALSFERLAASL